MLSNTLLTIAASLAIAKAQDVYLTVESDNDEVNGNSLGYPHSGAGLNYFFLGSSTPSALNYDADQKTIIYDTNEFFSIASNMVALTVAGPDGEVSFESDGTLLLNGSPDNFYACKNTGDPYGYSESSYQLMYYGSGAPDDCIAITLYDAGSSSPLSSTTSSPGNSTVCPTCTYTQTTTQTNTDTVCPTCTEVTTTETQTNTDTVCPTCTDQTETKTQTETSTSTDCSTSEFPSTYEGNAAQYIPAGTFALLAGAAAALM